MARRVCTGDGLLAAFRAAVANLEAHVDEINALNVYPVPDGDTGSNMAATARAALAEAESAGTRSPADRIASAISLGALMGARGNSGVITSQILRGMSDSLATRTRFTGADLAQALSKGSEAAYRAVARPVEGTILTVIHDASTAAVVASDGGGDLETVLIATVEAAEMSVARTPTLLAVLREAGVVDAGGQGLYRLLQGALRHLVDGTLVAPAAPSRVSARPALAAPADNGYGYETMFLLQARPGAALDQDALRTYLEGIGESVLVAGDERALKIHVHNDRPDLVLAHGLGLGVLSRISVENLDGQVHSVREARAAAFTHAGDSAGAAASQLPPDRDIGAAVPAPANSAQRLPRELGASPPNAGAVPLAVIAVVVGDGLEAVFRNLGVTGIVKGGQGANPSTGELLAAIQNSDAREIVLLPNNPNVILAALQVARMAGRPVEVVPTRNAAEGFAAMLALDLDIDAAGNVAPMTNAARAVQTLAVTEAVRDSTIGGRRVERGKAIALDPDDGLVAVASDPRQAVCSAVKLLRPGFELLTIYYGDGSSADDAHALARMLADNHDGLQVEVVHGGQPYYRYLIAAE